MEAVALCCRVLSPYCFDVQTAKEIFQKISICHQDTPFLIALSDVLKAANNLDICVVHSGEGQGRPKMVLPQGRKEIPRLSGKSSF